MTAMVVLEWAFSPPDYFEDVNEIILPNCTIRIGRGIAQAQIDPLIFDANPSMRQKLQDNLHQRFRAVGVLTHQSYKLSYQTMIKISATGERSLFVSPESARAMVKVTANIRINDKDGNIILDTKRDRIQHKKKFSDLVAFHGSDATLDCLLRSYDAALRDPNNELVHLYEIRDALKVKFGNEDSARAALGIGASDWSQLGRLCNGELRQGRHRGSAGDGLRDATAVELTTARDLA